jgi:hypothetical protein
MLVGRAGFRPSGGSVFIRTIVCACRVYFGIFLDFPVDFCKSRPTKVCPSDEPSAVVQLIG